MIDPAWAKVATDWAQYILTAGAGGLGGIWLYATRRDTARAEQIAGLAAGQAEQAKRIATVEAAQALAPTRERCHANDQRLIRLEAARETSPTQSDIKRVEERIHQRIDALSESLSELSGEVHASIRLLGTIDQHLRDHPR